MEHEQLCSFFGCAKKLTLLEKLCGDKCTAHSGANEELVGRKTKEKDFDMDNLSKREAILLLQSGKTMRHRFFLPEETIRQTTSGKILLDNGSGQARKMFADIFWNFRKSEEWNSGWSIVSE